jgi:hypothetical protein
LITKQRRSRFARPCLQALEARMLLSFNVFGVQPAALDQPQVNAVLRRTPTGAPLTADFYGITTYNIQAYYDTGSSGALLSAQTADGLGVNLEEVGGQPVVYSDVGVGGTDDFNVSESLYLSLGVYGMASDPTDPFADPPLSSYTQSFGPMRFQVGPVPEPDNPLLQGLDVIGMPAIQGKVIVMDPKPLNATVEAYNASGDIFDLIGGGMVTYIYNPGTPYNPAQADTDPGIPTVNRHVRLSYGSFAQFTTLTPPGAVGPAFESNPFIGPNPVAPAGDTTPGVTVKLGARSATGSYLLDTGAAASMISQATAEKLGVQYAPGTYGTDNPVLVDAGGNSLSDQFFLTIGGIGGTVKSAGFWLDEMDVPTIEGDPIRFVSAPVIVSDITVKDPVTNQTLTLDGIFGMNNLVGSVFISETGGVLPDIGQAATTPFNWLVFDSVNKILGLDAPLPTPTAMATIGTAGNDAYYARLSPDHTTLQIYNTPTPTGTPAWSYATTQVASMVFHTADGNDTLILDASNGMPTMPITFAAGAGNDTLVLTGLPSGVNLQVQPGQVVVGATAVACTGVENTRLTAPAGALVQLGSVTVGAPVALATGGLVLRAGGLAMAALGTLDLADGQMILDYSGATPAQTVRGWVINGMAGATPSIRSSTLSSTKALAMIDNVLVHMTSSGGQALASPFSQILIKPYWRGDANLDGQVDEQDLLSVLTNMGRSSSQWLLGDLDQNGNVDLDDYAQVLSNLGAGSMAASANLMVAPLQVAVVAKAIKVVAAPAKAAPAASVKPAARKGVKANRAKVRKRKVVKKTERG